MGDVKQFMRLVAVEPEDCWLRFKLGTALLEAGQADNAIGELQRATLEPDLRGEARLLLASALLERGELAQAARLATLALRELSGAPRREAASLLRRIRRHRHHNRKRLPFDTGALRALRVAKGKARQLGHMLIGTEHVLLGLLAEPQGIVARTLATHGVTPARALAEVSRLVPGLECDFDPLARPATVRVRDALASAAQLAGYLGEEKVGPEHIFLGSLSLERCAAQEVLKRLAVDLVAVEAAVAQEIERGPEVALALPNPTPRVWGIPATTPPSTLRVQAIPAATPPESLAVAPAPGLTLVQAGVRLVIAFAATYLLGQILWPLLRSYL